MLLLTLTGALLLSPALSGFSADAPIATIPVGRAPSAIAVNPLTHRVFVTNYWEPTVSIIDGVSDTVTATVDLGYLPIPLAVVSNPIASPPRAYVANFWANTITVIDESTNNTSAVIPSNGVHAGGPRALALNPSGPTPKLYIADYGSSLVTVVDAETYAPITTIPVGDTPRALGIFASASHTRIYVANRGSATVSVIDGDTDQVVATLPTGVAPKAIAIDHTTGYAYVSNETSDTVTVISDSDEVTATIDVGFRPVGLAIDETGGRLFVANFDSGTVSVIRTSDFSLEAKLPVGTNPWAIAFDQGDRKAYVTNNGDGTTSVIDSALNVTSVACGTQPYAVAVDEGATPHKAYVGNWGSNDVTVIDEPLGPALADLLVSRAYAADDPVLVTIDPDVLTSSGISRATGSATDARSKYPAAIAAVFYRIAPSTTWLRAEITAGEFTPDVRWSAELGEMPADGVTLEVVALDQTGATSSTSDGGTALSASAVGGSGTALLVEGATVPHPTATTLALQEATWPAYRLLAATVTCTEPGCAGPTGTVAFEKLGSEGWAGVGSVELTDGSAALTISKHARGTYRARYLGDGSHAESTSESLTYDHPVKRR